jgi:hypothetical protein
MTLVESSKLLPKEIVTSQAKLLLRVFVIGDESQAAHKIRIGMLGIAFLI